MSDPVAFVRARYDEREAVAKAAQQSASSDRELAQQAGAGVTDAGYLHIAANGPALREVQAMRAILALHTPDTARYSPETLARLAKFSALACPVCVTERGEYREDWGADRFPCQTVRALVSVFSGHPDYDPAWAER